jgi:hypothetical protein
MIDFRFHSIEWTDYGARVLSPSHFVTAKHETSAWPHPEDPHYAVIAHRCGYRDDLLGYCREHELAHILVSQEIRGTPSYVIDAQALGVEPDLGMAIPEEFAAQALQRFARANEEPIIAGFDWNALRALFLGHVHRLNSDLAARLVRNESSIQRDTREIEETFAHARKLGKDKS